MIQTQPFPRHNKCFCWRVKNPISYLFVGVCLVLAQSTTFAGPVYPVSYDMPNGDGTASGGSYNYWDKEYTGAGSTTTDSAPLSGGLGNLTDGVIATDNWHMVENGFGTGPYVGWINRDPTITFNFAGPVYIDDITLHLDDANGFGGVSLPSAIVYRVDGGAPMTSVVTDPATLTPIAWVIDLNQVVNGTVEITLKRQNFWVFMSEVEFSGSASGVPDASNAALLLFSAVGLLGGLRTRFQRS